MKFTKLKCSYLLIHWSVWSRWWRKMFVSIIIVDLYYMFNVILRFFHFRNAENQSCKSNHKTNIQKTNIFNCKYWYILTKPEALNRFWSDFGGIWTIEAEIVQFWKTISCRSTIIWTFVNKPIHLYHVSTLYCWYLHVFLLIYTRLSGLSA